MAAELDRARDAGPTLHVVVSCKSRKTMAVSRELCMSSIQATSLDERAKTWIERLRKAPASRRNAADMYAGDHWKLVLKIPAAAGKDAKVKLWVVSAGYGVVGIDSPLKPYSATFIPTHSDSVVPMGSSFTASQWWREITRRVPQQGLPRRVTDIATLAQRDGGYLLLALSKPYARALAEDICAASELLPDRIALVSVGLSAASNGREGIGKVLLPVEARLKNVHQFRGAMQGLNARIAYNIVAKYKRWYPNTEKLRHLIRRWVQSADPLTRYDRKKLSDDQIRSYIRTHVNPARRRSKSLLLRSLRDSGKACEQGRFSRLYTEVIAGMSGRRHAVGGDRS